MSGTRINAYQRPVNLLEISERGQQKAAPKSSPAGESFRDVMSKELGSGRPVSFSKHAGERLHSRGIEMPQERIQQVADALDKAEAKGSRETLILFDDLALVASVKSRTVITAFDRDKLREGVVTSIDSAIII
jgi:flagellar operon protein